MYTVFHLGRGHLQIPTGGYLGPAGSDRARGIVPDELLPQGHVLWRLAKTDPPEVVIVPGEVATLEEARGTSPEKPPVIKTEAVLPKPSPPPVIEEVPTPTPEVTMEPPAPMAPIEEKVVEAPSELEEVMGGLEEDTPVRRRGRPRKS